MALIGRLKYDALTDDEIVHKVGSENLVLGTQVVVNEGQEAVFVKEGRALDVLGPGTHTLSTSNIPVLQRLINLPFGGKTPFTAEVWYVNRHAKLDMTWGTEAPFPVTDPQFKILVPVRAWGQFGIRVKDSRALITQLVATLHDWDADTVRRYFSGLLVSKLKDTIAKAIVRDRIPVLELTAWLDEISGKVRVPVAEEMDRWGLEIVNLYVTSITIPEDDPAVVKLREVLGTRAELDVLGDGYKLKRTFDVLETTAGNSSGVAGSLLSGGLGLGIGLGAAPALGANLAGALAPAAATANAAAPQRFCPACGGVAVAGAKFCSKCGSAFAAAGGACSKCTQALPPGAAFCPFCGQKA
ncbi:MAG: SPFH domain-containing protein [Actinomycetota bacterium]|nr:SPFH domain-containing protein [Actinomycetota bacterium]